GDGSDMAGLRNGAEEFRLRRAIGGNTIDAVLSRSIESGDQKISSIGRPSWRIVGKVRGEIGDLAATPLQNLNLLQAANDQRDALAVWRKREIDVVLGWDVKLLFGALAVDEKQIAKRVAKRTRSEGDHAVAGNADLRDV